MAWWDSVATGLGIGFEAVNPFNWVNEEGQFLGPAGVVEREWREQVIGEKPPPTAGEKTQAAAEKKATGEEGLAAAATRATEEAVAPFQPFIGAGQEALPGMGQLQQTGLGATEAQAALMGLRGPEAQRAAIAQLEASPQFQALAGQGEQAILANAAATGGVRGGNTQAALAQFRPQLLSSLINQQYQNLMGLSGLGAQAGQQLVGTGLQGAGQSAQTTMQGTALSSGLAAQALGTRAAGEVGNIQYGLDTQQKYNDLLLALLGAGAKLGGTAIGAMGGGPAGAAAASQTPGV